MSKEQFVKMTKGYVAQTFEKKNNLVVCVKQEFFIDGEITYHDVEDGSFFQKNDIPDYIDEPFAMVTPTGNVSMFLAYDVSRRLNITEPFEAGDLTEAQGIMLQGFNVEVKEDE